jgi:hypothetical protein
MNLFEQLGGQLKEAAKTVLVIVSVPFVAVGNFLLDVGADAKAAAKANKDLKEPHQEESKNNN